ncbi:ASB_HP2_G0005310.mRNA.1.CDS.1 [Saccharomyces cerevisiae]|uniref:Uncharacterized protein n=1 Tax=Marinifilum caeruleilacunae TaxID=2499076 RepID=A0ABX1X2U4_9BACT|nr:hypothetical protein F842_YJM1078C00023 [Saccharomyces cerevisiae YJM1078]AJQ44075.1 hypothetical protein H751_YJM248C00023 [Saccharomyces cerevisiae YJM248]KZV12804.1 hypothetical protein WN66_00611 [Saccharomyces cerevisiae]NOU62423.1 hypothetical protein [Marinifilum caeruleilacunae]UZT75773.1 hypothetical protein OPV43_018 [Saccharomyces cerevisiae synthetic construct]
MQIKNIVAVLATVTAINAQVGIEPNATTPNATQPNTTLPTASVTTTVSIGEAVVNTMAAGAFGAAIAAGVAFLF